jgi:indole-3-glycerol phosphate synthase
MSGVRQTGTILDQIVAVKREEVEKLKGRGQEVSPPAKGRDREVSPTRDLTAALRAERPGRAVIAEIKRASPSAGVIREPFLPAEIARAYAANGARAISVLTDEKFFQGSLAVLREVRATVELPLLRKDFIIDRVQITEAAEAGADAVLLIARILDNALMAELYAAAGELGLAALIEVRDAEDLRRTLMLQPAPQLIGVNNRDLADFTVSIQRTLDLIPVIPRTVTLVSESGLSDPATLDRLRAAGVQAFLIGTSLMKAADPGEALKRMVHG